ncbi:uncharacterized protein BDV17DRAFT_271395 [Aspergillus undulatus]|uniref:uncharacterized protein n=1 Tax=Aspergillus undulatus TaxID=1810928 RepID=UPI003CCDCCA5
MYRLIPGDCLALYSTVRHFSRLFCIDLAELFSPVALLFLARLEIGFSMSLLFTASCWFRSCFCFCFAFSFPFSCSLPHMYY